MSEIKRTDILRVDTKTQISKNIRADTQNTNHRDKTQKDKIIYSEPLLKPWLRSLDNNHERWALKYGLYY